MPKTIKSPLVQHINSQLPLNAKNDFKDEVMKQCDISENTYYIRLRNPALFSPIEKKFIADYLKTSEQDLF